MPSELDGIDLGVIVPLSQIEDTASIPIALIALLTGAGNSPAEAGRIVPLLQIDVDGFTSETGARYFATATGPKGGGENLGVIVPSSQIDLDGLGFSALRVAPGGEGLGTIVPSPQIDVGVLGLSALRVAPGKPGLGTIVPSPQIDVGVGVLGRSALRVAPGRPGLGAIVPLPQIDVGDLVPNAPAPGPNGSCVGTIVPSLQIEDARADGS
ncbi:MAG: hypothetical protein GC138_06445 [Gammaproteobacteria bacterium]|nr:hypothetical protein [Gammaproteobacteria bacterium]